ncbi:hypothetical protein [Nitrospira sp. Ecomares 2.1]
MWQFRGRRYLRLGCRESWEDRDRADRHRQGHDGGWGLVGPQAHSRERGRRYDCSHGNRLGQAGPNRSIDGGQWENYHRRNSGVQQRAGDWRRLKPRRRREGFRRQAGSLGLRRRQPDETGLSRRQKECTGVCFPGKTANGLLNRRQQCVGLLQKIPLYVDLERRLNDPHTRISEDKLAIHRREFDGHSRYITPPLFPEGREAFFVLLCEPLPQRDGTLELFERISR